MSKAFELNQAGAMLSVGAALAFQVGDPKRAIAVLASAEARVAAARRMVGADDGTR